MDSAAATAGANPTSFVLPDGTAIYQPSTGAVLAAALLAARTQAAEAQERVRTAALAWERERTAAAALARRVAEAEHYLFGSSAWLSFVDYSATATTSSHQALSATTCTRPDPADPVVAQLHLQAAGVQNIRALVPVVLDPASSSYGRWRDLVLLTLRRYALDNHILLDTPVAARDPAWQRLDSVALSWIFGTLSLDLQDIVRAPRGTAH